MCFAELTSAQRAELRAVLGERVPLANPLDYHTYIWGEPEAMADAFTAMVRGPADLTCSSPTCRGPTAAPTTTGWLADHRVRPACAAADARGALVAAMAANLTGERAAAWVRQGLAVLAPPAVAMEAIEAAACIGRAWAGPSAPPVAGPRGRGGGATVLNEATGKRLLRQNGRARPRRSGVRERRAPRSSPRPTSPARSW